MTEQQKKPRGMKNLGALLDIPKAGTGPVATAAPEATTPKKAPAKPAGETLTPAETPAPRAEQPSAAISTPETPKETTDPASSAHTATYAFERYRSFDDYERKDTRQRTEQIAWIERTRKDLNRRRAGAGERLTDNTLYRVAIDLLISRAGDLAGTTEAELRASLGLNDADLV